MTIGTNDEQAKPATAARIYDYLLGGTHNFAADREAAAALVRLAPAIAGSARVNRAFLRRAVRYVTEAGVRQFLDIGSGIPTVGNVHEIAQVRSDARVVYVDVDPVAVAESLEILDGKAWATAVRGDIREPRGILDHPAVRELIDFDEPIGLLLAAVLHFVDDDDEADRVVDQLRAALAPGSCVVISHASVPDDLVEPSQLGEAEHIYRHRTSSQLRTRDRASVEAFFTGLELVEPGLVWAPQWRPELDDPTDFADKPSDCAILAGVAYKL